MENNRHTSSSEADGTEPEEAGRAGEDARIRLVSRTKDGEEETVASIERTGRDPDVWTLRPGDSGKWPEGPGRLLDRARDLLLPRHGERLNVECPDDGGAMRAELERRAAEKGYGVRRHGDLFTVDLITADDEGDVHDDYDNRTPLETITCTTCLLRIAEGREVERTEAFNKSPGPGVVAFYTRRVGEAYLQLARAEERLATKWGHTPEQIAQGIDHPEKKLPEIPTLTRSRGLVNE